MARTCGNCSRSNKDINYIPGNKVGTECLCTLKDELKDIEESPCNQWIGNIKERKDV